MMIRLRHLLLQLLLMKTTVPSLSFWLPMVKGSIPLALFISFKLWSVWDFTMSMSAPLSRGSSLLFPEGQVAFQSFGYGSRNDHRCYTAEIDGAIAYEVSGTPVDCVSLALSGALFSWSKPLLVISGINRGSSCGHHMYHSGVVSGAREAFISGVPSLSLSLNRKREESQESDFKDVVAVSLPLINAAIRDIEKGVFLKTCFLSIEIPISPSANKAVSASRCPSAAHFMPNQQSLGLQLAQLGRDASATGAARHGTTQSKSEEVESVGAAKSDTRVKKYFRLEKSLMKVAYPNSVYTAFILLDIDLFPYARNLQFIDKESKETAGGLDFKALNDGFIAVTPLSVSPQLDSDIQTAASSWISGMLSGGGGEQ
ncbi:hypothetical protein V6N11_047611 [Hibiscus sabdariffa]|uniref:Survival protein SurE-like phosphatase/nucleotidase domain-containing protein n=1 Tax=Hibiscus sabdariffa TaxID=183260 RepID=A0ABR2NL14_9ROSI